MAKFKVRVSVGVETDTEDWKDPGEKTISVATALERFKEDVMGDPEFFIGEYVNDIKFELLPISETVEVNLVDNLSLGDKIS